MAQKMTICKARLMMKLEPLTDSLCAQTGIAKTNSCDEIIIETDDISNKGKENNKSVQNAVK